ncbi:hypothetical protein Bbelb_029070 [Branchiostoma belcheri]|nr:hypothetical protein Bbelb_029070 [Branchiostoma belcheri]
MAKRAPIDGQHERPRGGRTSETPHAPYRRTRVLVADAGEAEVEFPEEKSWQHNNLVSRRSKMWKGSSRPDLHHNTWDSNGHLGYSRVRSSRVYSNRRHYHRGSCRSEALT